MVHLILNLLVLPDCAPCKILELKIASRVEEKGLSLRKIVAKHKEGTENYVLVASDGTRSEVHASAIPGFPSLWVTYPDGSVSTVIMGVEKDGRDALDFLLEEGALASVHQ